MNTKLSLAKDCPVMDTKIVIVGGGAAGLFAAAQLGELGLGRHCLVIEKTLKPAAKVLISGGGRCNVTHACFDPKKLCESYPRGHLELLGPFKRFGPSEMMEWLHHNQVALKTESDGRVFPITDRSQTIVDCLMNKALEHGVEIKIGSSVESITHQQTGYELQTSHGLIQAKYLLLCTGSHPSGAKLAKNLGHSLKPAIPSLFSLHLEPFFLQDLAGVSVEARVWTTANQAQEGAMLITHVGFSGPAILKLSAWQAVELHQANYQTQLWVDWLFKIELEHLQEQLLAAKHKNSSLGALFENYLPKSLARTLLTTNEMDPSLSARHYSDKSLKKLAEKIKKWPFTICSKSTHKQEFVTCGGVELKEINFKRFESKLLPNLFFAGEILNIDAVTGGFNFQNAWTSAWHVAQAIYSDMNLNERDR